MKEQPGRRVVELLLEEANERYRDGRDAESLRAAERAVEAAQGLQDVGLEIRSATAEATALFVLGDYAAALTGLMWILGVAEDASRRPEIERAGAEWYVVNAYSCFVDVACHLPGTSAEQLFCVLSAGDDYCRGVGRPTWRGPLLAAKARVLAMFGRTQEAITCAEEASALGVQRPAGHGGKRESGYWWMGDLLRDLGQYDNAKAQYAAVLDNRESGLYERRAALIGLARCALVEGEAARSRKHAEDAVGLAEGMGEDALQPALSVLIQAYRTAGDLPAARAAAERIVDGARRLASDYRLRFALLDAADVALDDRSMQRANRLIDEAESLVGALDCQRGSTMFQRDIHRLRLRLRVLTAGEGKPPLE